MCPSLVNRACWLTARVFLLYRKAAAKNETDRDVGPSARVKREADSDGGEEVVFVKKPRHEAVSANELK